MKTFADEVLAALPDLMAAHPDGPTVAAVARHLESVPADVRVAFETLDTAERATMIRYRGRAVHLIPLGSRLACRHCHIEFARNSKSKARCCSRKCGIAWSWTLPGVREKRGAAIKAQKATPEAIALHAEINRKRWSKPGEREKLAERSRRMWADPEQKAKLAGKIKAEHSTPEKRAFYGEARRREWQDPTQRAKREAALRKALCTPEYRAKSSEVKKRQWRDPVWRAKWTAANIRRNEKRRNAKLLKIASTYVGVGP